MKTFAGKTNRKLSLTLLLLLCISGCSSLPGIADFREPGTGTPFIFVKGGTYQMGSNVRPEERPVHTVTIPDLYISIYETTFNQYDAFCNEMKCEPPSDEGWGRGNRPVINVSWHDAMNYAAWLSDRNGQTYRLPSEAEWEHFARAGTTTTYWTGENLPEGSANCRDCGSKWDNKMTAPVGSFKPNPWGIYDTAGNVAEWVLDDYHKGYSESGNDNSPLIRENKKRKAQRGGAWNYNKFYVRSGARDYSQSFKATNEGGFRLVLVPDESTPAPKMK